MKIDLHLHSNCSDGVYSPEELVAAAQRCGLEVIALTDHDSVAGLERALAAGAELGVRVIPGVELSLQLSGFSGVHMLGYFVRGDDARLNAALEEMRQVRARRGELILEKVNRMLAEEGKRPLSLARLRELAQGAVGRPHISRLLVEQGYAADIQEAFDNYLVPCNVPKKRLLPGEAVALIRGAGGLPVLAHPHILSDSRKKASADDQAALIRQMADWGVVGLEAYYTDYTPEEVEFYLGQARRNNLLVTAGSDFHGTDEGVVLGELSERLQVPAEMVVEGLRECYRRLYGCDPWGG